ncbi:hypothetical protein ACET3Z_031053 [Daucus carota]
MFQVQENESNVLEGAKEVSMSVELGPGGKDQNSGKKSEIFVRPHDEANQGPCESGSEQIMLNIALVPIKQRLPNWTIHTKVFLPKGHGSKKGGRLLRLNSPRLLSLMKSKELKISS